MSISDGARIGQNVKIRDSVIVEEHVTIGDGCYLDYGCIIRSGTVLGAGSYVGPYCILGEFNFDFYHDFCNKTHAVCIGDDALIRSHSVLYGGSKIASGFQTGHHVTIRENTQIGEHVRIGTLSDIQGDCLIGDYVNLHSNVHIGKATKIGSYVWIFPYCIFTNDPIPPSEHTWGVTVDDYAVIATASVLLPGVSVGEHALVGAGSVVTRDVLAGKVVVGNPAQTRKDIAQILDPVTGQPAYPWPAHFSRNMPWRESGFSEWLKSRGKGI